MSQLSKNLIKKIYLSVSKEYNKTPLSTKHKWVHKPNDYGLKELLILAKYIKKDMKILDIGTGMGIAPRFAKKINKNNTVISIDSYAASGITALENVKPAGIETHSVDILKDKLPFESNSIDLIFFGDVIEHLLHSPKPAIEEFYRVLKPSGYCISATPNAVRLTTRIKVLAGYSNWSNLDDFWEKDFNEGHHHEYTIDEFCSVFERVGFLVVEKIMEESNLKNNSINKFSDLKSQKRRIGEKQKEGIFYYLKKIALILVNIFPSLKSSMILVVKKPSF